MKIFISWSGDVSHAVALSLRDWLPSVLQSADPYVSSEDIEKGARWSTEIGQQLEETSFGILCVTPQNLNSPWLNFEAGALSKSLDTSRVSPFLLGIRQADLTGPLAQFQATLPQIDDVVRLIKSMNAVSERPIDESRLTDITQMWWPRLEEGLNAAFSKESQTGVQEPQRDTNEMIQELLEITRGLQRQLVREGVDEPRGITESLYPSRSQRARGIRSLMAEISAFLTGASPERNWDVVEKDGAIRVIFRYRPESVIVRGIGDMAENTDIDVDIIVPRDKNEYE